MNRKPTANQKPATVAIRVTIGGVTYEETIAGELVAMKGGK